MWFTWPPLVVEKILMVPPHCLTYQRNQRAEISWGSEVTFTLTNSVAKRRAALHGNNLKEHVCSCIKNPHLMKTQLNIFLSSQFSGVFITLSSKPCPRALSWSCYPTLQHVGPSMELLLGSAVHHHSQLPWRTSITMSMSLQSKKWIIWKA